MLNSQNRLILFTASLTKSAITLALAGAVLSACSPEQRYLTPSQVPDNAKGDRDKVVVTKPIINNPIVTEATWATKDPQVDGIEGVSADRAYAELNLKTGVPAIIVAVIDSGVDIEH